MEVAHTEKISTPIPGFPPQNSMDIPELPRYGGGFGGAGTEGISRTNSVTELAQNWELRLRPSGGGLDNTGQIESVELDSEAGSIASVARIPTIRDPRLETPNYGSAPVAPQTKI